MHVKCGGREFQGASVFETRWFDRTQDVVRAPNAGAFRAQVWAEAAIVDLEENGLLFALLAQRNELGFLPMLFPSNLAADAPVLEREQLLRLATARGEYSVPRDRWPTFVRFENIGSPASVQEVTVENVSAQYGAGAEISALTMELVDDQPTIRIRRVLPWLDELKTNLGGGHARFSRGPVAQRIVASDFGVWGKSFN